MFRNLSISLLVLLAFRSATVAQIPITTILNADFEAGTGGQAVDVGWTTAASTGPMFLVDPSTAASLEFIDPNSAYSGTQFLTGNRNAGSYPANEAMGVFQDVDLSPYSTEINQGGRGLQLEFAYNDADPQDSGVVSFSFLDGGNNPIGGQYMFETDDAPTGGGAWSTSSLLGEVPVGASSMRISLLANPGLGGTLRNINYDAINANLLPSIPTPAVTDRVNGTLIQFDADGNWTWYSDERAVVDPNNGHVLVNSVGFSPNVGVGNRGDIDVVNFNPATGRRERTPLSNQTPGNPNIQNDDHNNGALLVLPDGRYLALYANHGNAGGLGDIWTRWRVSDNPGDSSSWSTEQLFDWDDVPDGGVNVSYHNLFYLSAEDQVYNISRANNQAPNILLYDPATNSLSYGGQVVDSSTGGYSTGYFKYASNGIDRIYFTHTETHPRNFNTSIYSGYIENGQSYDMQGNLIDSDIFDNESVAGGSGDVPDVTEFTLVQQADPLGDGYNRLWTVDTGLDSSGRPMALYTSRWNPDGSVDDGGTNNPIDHRLHFARWNPTTEQWEAQEIAKMGQRLYTSEQDYTGLGALVPGDENTLYISTTSDPRDVTGSTETEKHEIYKGVFDGNTWNWSAITEDSSVDNLRPIVPDAHGGDRTVLWFRGDYNTAQSIDAAVVGIVERDEATGAVHYVDANNSNTMFANGSPLQTSTPAGGQGPDDNQWHLRTGFGNEGDVLTSNESGSENAPMLKTTIEGLDEGTYDVFAYFWSDNDEDWRLLAGLESDNLIDFRRFGSQHAAEEQFAAIDTVSANSNDLLLYRAYLGRTEVAAGSSIEAFLDDWSTSDNNLRTWYDGLGYSLVSNTLLAGDFDQDGDVDGRDFLLWQRGKGTIYDETDLADWRANYGQSSFDATQGQRIPEPTAWLLFMTATSALSTRFFYALIRIL